MAPPVFAHGALRLYLLALLEEGPKHGYELIRALSDRFGGAYSPSPGTVYPRLSKLEEEGLVLTRAEGRRTLYSVTEAGLAELDARRGDLADVEEDIAASVHRLADSLRTELKATMRGLRADLAATAETARHTARRAAAGAEGVGRLAEAEMLVQAFRDDIRVELRTHTATRPLSEVTLETLRTVLGQARIAIRNSLR
ncbi:PadR family transcriptional regulator [Sinomonas mesophila]|uniref:PadR family transcriptional regulator n=1 Tax=Sinomonas mesophila TaxID=1531955 RepID=UPI000984E96C|nr:PadR family transcriptional regulator [Sinomonas mesophila]